MGKIVFLVYEEWIILIICLQSQQQVLSWLILMRKIWKCNNMYFLLKNQELRKIIWLEWTLILLYLKEIDNPIHKQSRFLLQLICSVIFILMNLFSLEMNYSKCKFLKQKISISSFNLMKNHKMIKSSIMIESKVLLQKDPQNIFEQWIVKRWLFMEV